MTIPRRFIEDGVGLRIERAADKETWEEARKRYKPAKHPNEYYRINTGAERDFFAVVVTHDDGTGDVITNKSGTWQLDWPLLADILMPEQKHMDWIVDKVAEKDVPSGWEKLINQPRGGTRA